MDMDPEIVRTAPPAVDGATAAAGGAAPTVATTTTVTGVAKKRRQKHNHAARDARKSQCRRLLAQQDGAPEPGTGTSSRRPSVT